LRYCTRELIRTSVFLCSTVLLLVCSPVFGAATECEPVKPPAPDTNSSHAKTLKLQTEWKRAIDQDKASELWRLLAEVDAGRVDVKSTNDKGKTALMAAVKIGDQCLLEELLRRGLRVSDKGTTGGTALMYAVLGNNTGMIEVVLSREPELNAQSTNGWTAAMIAAAKGFEGSIAQLFTAGADINLADVYQWTPLMRAIDNRHSSVVNYLLSLPVIEVNKANENGSTALHIAAQAGDQAVVTRLLQLGSEVTAVDKNGYTAADLAIRNGHPDIAKQVAR